MNGRNSKFIVELILFAINLKLKAPSIHAPLNFLGNHLFTRARVRARGGNPTSLLIPDILPCPSETSCLQPNLLEILPQPSLDRVH